MDGHEQDLDHRIKYLDAGLDSNGPTDHEGSPPVPFRGPNSVITQMGLTLVCLQGPKNEPCRT